jgi:GT2 family glycosyltransferase
MISASIVLYKNDERINKAINCLLEANVFNQIFLIDNSPTDVLKHKLANVLQLPSVTYIFNNANIGFGAAHNIAIRLAMKGSDYHLIMNPDVYFEPTVPSSLVAYMEQHLEVGLVQPKIFYPNGELQHNCQLLPTPVDLILRRFIPSFLIKKRMGQFHLKFFSYNQEMGIPYLLGCFMLFRVRALMDIGLFDERFFMYPEDIDITRRMYTKHKSIFYPSVSIVHEHEQGSYKSLKLFYIHITNMIKYFNKWGWFFDKERKVINKEVLNSLKDKN